MGPMDTRHWFLLNRRPSDVVDGLLSVGQANLVIIQVKLEVRH